MKRPDAPIPPIVEQCTYIDQGSEPYFYCRSSDGSEKRWRRPANESLNNKMVCTTTTDYTKAIEYSKKFDAYVDYKLKQCGK